MKISNSERFFRLQDLFNLNAKEWFELLNLLEGMSPIERDVEINGDFYDPLWEYAR